MAARRTSGGRTPAGPRVGTIVTGTIVGQAKRGVLVELGSCEILLPRARFGAAADRIEAAGFGEALTVEVVADGPGGAPGLSRVGIERSLRQPREMEATLGRAGAGLVLAPTDGGAPFAVWLLDRFDPVALVGTTGRWLVGAPYRCHRFAVVASSGPSSGLA